MYYSFLYLQFMRTNHVNNIMHVDMEFVLIFVMNLSDIALEKVSVKEFDNMFIVEVS